MCGRRCRNKYYSQQILRKHKTHTRPIHTHTQCDCVKCWIEDDIPYYKNLDLWIQFNKSIDERSRNRNCINKYFRGVVYKLIRYRHLEIDMGEKNIELKLCDACVRMAKLVCTRFWVYDRQFTSAKPVCLCSAGECVFIIICAKSRHFILYISHRQ